MLKKEFIVDNSMTDKNGKATPDALAGIMQDMAAEHSFVTGVGKDDIKKHHGVVWMVAKTKFVIHRAPMLNERIIGITASTCAKRIVFPRYFKFEDSDGNVLASSVSEWILVDEKTREIMRSDTVDDIWKRDEEGFEAEIVKVDNININCDFEKNLERSPILEEIDSNGHVNNAVYIKWVLDTLDNREVEELNIHYSQEIMPDNVINISAHEQNHEFVIVGRDKLTNAIHFKASGILK